MIKHIPFQSLLLAVGALWLAAPTATVGAGTADAARVDFETGQDVPPGLAVPSGHVLVFEAVVSEGAQTYRCAPDGKYVLLGPTAMLRGHQNQYAAHYFGPAWQYQDGSALLGKVLAKEPHPNAVDQLLLQVTEHNGRDGLFSKVDFIRRLATVGGVAPLQCDSTRDATLAVAYTAIYQFWALIS